MRIRGTALLGHLGATGRLLRHIRVVGAVSKLFDLAALRVPANGSLVLQLAPLRVLLELTIYFSLSLGYWHCPPDDDSGCATVDNVWCSV